MLSRFVFAGLASVLLATPAHAQQIYTWHDDGGNLILSNQARAASAPALSYAVPHAQAIRTTRFVQPDKTRAYDDLIETNARANNVRPDLVRAVIQVESGFNPAAKSPKGAMGLMQLMPATVQQLHVANPYNPADNVRGGVVYLRTLLDRYDDNEELALAAYNAGPAAVDKHGESVPPYRETQQYVSKVSDLAGASRVPGTEVYRSMQVIGEQRVPLLSNTPDPRVSPAALSQAGQADRTPDRAPQSAPALQTP